MEWNPNTFANASTRTGQPQNVVAGIESRLTFGRSIPKEVSGFVIAETVSDYSVRAFLDGVVLPRFPDGFTYTESRGCWKGGQEDSFSVSVIYVNHGKARKDYGVKLEEIRAEYIRLFRQDSVLRTDTLVAYSFA
jgi:hypothetical protein